jgi:hypothetical protein
MASLRRTGHLWWGLGILAGVLLLVSQLLGAVEGRDTPEQHKKHAKEAVEQEYKDWLGRVGAGYTAKKAALVSGVEDTLASQVAPFANQLSTASTRTIVVDKSGKGNYKTVQAAVNSVKNGNSQRVIIQINAGTYK